MGNIIELCAAQLYPDPKTYLGFTMCLMKQYERIPDQSLIEDCALEHAIDFKLLNECTAKDDGAYGLRLLRKSVQRTAEVGNPRTRIYNTAIANHKPRLGGGVIQLHSSAGREDLLHSGRRQVERLPGGARRQRPDYCDREAAFRLSGSKTSIHSSLASPSV